MAVGNSDDEAGEQGTATASGGHTYPPTAQHVSAPNGGTKYRSASKSEKAQSFGRQVQKFAQQQPLEVTRGATNVVGFAGSSIGLAVVASAGVISPGAVVAGSAAVAVAGVNTYITAAKGYSDHQRAPPPKKGPLPAWRAQR